MPDWRPLEIATPELAEEHRLLRERCPVSRAAIPGLPPLWSLLRYEDVTKAARDTVAFANSSARLSMRRVPLESDPPEHTKIRRLMQPFFMPARIAQFESLTRQYAVELIEPFVAGRGGDIVAAVSRPLPPQVLLTFIGQPREDWRRVKQWSEQSFLQMSEKPEHHRLFREADAALWAYSKDVVEARISTPRDAKTDLLTGMLHSRIDDQPVDRELVIGMVRLLLAAGHDSTTSALGICLHYLVRNPDDQAKLRADPQLIPTAVEEILRFESPVVMMSRTATRDTQLHGRNLLAGDRVMLNWASANRDQSAFENADRCILDRSPNRHVAFGHGIHTCIGAPLARQEIRVALQELLARTKDIELDGEVEYHIWHRYGPASLQVRLTPAAAP